MRHLLARYQDLPHCYNQRTFKQVEGLTQLLGQLVVTVRYFLQAYGLFFFGDRDVGRRRFLLLVATAAHNGSLGVCAPVRGRAQLPTTLKSHLNIFALTHVLGRNRNCYAHVLETAWALRPFLKITGGIGRTAPLMVFFGVLGARATPRAVTF